MDHFQSPRNEERMENPDIVGIAGVPGQGRFVALYLKVVDDVVVRATFRAAGCGATIASASMLTEQLQGKVLNSCKSMTSVDLMLALGGLPADKHYCAQFAVDALSNGLEALAATST
jgi:NifU-like protein involved in Fe-S cluster formation